MNRSQLHLMITGRLRLIVIMASVALLLVGCSRRFLSVFLDVPEEPEKPETIARPVTSSFAFMPKDTVRPAIESVFDPDSVVAMLPRDHAGNIDWMEALEQEIIKPRSQIEGEQSLPWDEGFLFGFDFYFESTSPMFDAYFPHSSHTKWVSCQQCHPRIFRSRGTKITMGDIAAGKFCGECHSKVAFPVTTGCERCHTEFPQPADRAQPMLIGDVQMGRVQQESAFAQDANIDESLREVFPRATFPHWMHRIRYKCKTCHMEIFEPRAGANEITMDDIGAGRACGKCHNGKVAFATSFGSCARCHLPTQTAKGGQ